MLRRATIIILIALLTVALGKDSSSWLPAADATYHLQISERSSWHPLIHLSHNSFIQWRLDPWLSWWGTATAEREIFTPVSALLSALLVFALGTILLLHQLQPGSAWFDKISESVLLSLLLAYLWGGDTVVLSSLAWLPLLIFALLSLFSAGHTRPFWFLLTMLLALKSSAAANTLGLFIVAAAVATAYFLSNSRGGARVARDERFWLLVIMVALPSLVILYLAPPPPYPDYPQLAHVVSNPGMAGMVRPLVGPAAPIPITDRAWIQSTYALPALALFFFTLLSLIGSAANSRGANYLLIGAALLALLDAALPEEAAHIMPVAVMNRLVPSFTFFPLLMPLLAWLLLLLALVGFRSRSFILPGLVVVLVILSRDSLDQPLNRERAAAGLQDERGRQTIQEYLRQQSQPTVDQKLHATFERLTISPSLAVFKDLGFWPIGRRSAIRNSRFPSLQRVARRHEFSLAASHNNEPEELKLLQDGAVGRRWSPGGGRQVGREWLQLCFAKEVTMRGLKAELGPASVADFPRGLRIAYCPDCTLNAVATERERYQEVISIPRWEGPLRVTKQGYLYYGGQSEVEVVFPQDATGLCFLIEQIGQTPRLDWSVEELRIWLLDR